MPRQENLTHAEFLDAFSGQAFCEPANSTISAFAALDPTQSITGAKPT